MCGGNTLPSTVLHMLVGASGKCEDLNLSDYTFSSDQAFLLRIVAEIVNERIEEIIVPHEFALCVLGIFKRSVGIVDFFSRDKSSLPTASINVLGYSLTILRDVCAREVLAGSNGDRSDIVDALQSSGLIALFLSLLHDLEPPAIIRKAMRLNENQERTSVYLSKTCPYIGFHKDIVAVIGNCAYRRKHIQDEIRERKGILLLLQQCVTDADNPFLREWGIWCVRSSLEGNAVNRQVISDLQRANFVNVPSKS